MVVLWLISRAKALTTRIAAQEDGLNTAELLGNAALAIVALVAIWAALRTLGLDVIDWVGAQIFGQA